MSVQLGILEGADPIDVMAPDYDAERIWLEPSIIADTDSGRIDLTRAQARQLAALLGGLFG